MLLTTGPHGGQQLQAAGEVSAEELLHGWQPAQLHEAEGRVAADGDLLIEPDPEQLHWLLADCSPSERRRLAEMAGCAEDQLHGLIQQQPRQLTELLGTLPGLRSARSFWEHGEQQGWQQRGERGWLLQPAPRRNLLVLRVGRQPQFLLLGKPERQWQGLCLELEAASHWHQHGAAFEVRAGSAQVQHLGNHQAALDWLSQQRQQASDQAGETLPLRLLHADQGEGFCHESVMWRLHSCGPSQQLLRAFVSPGISGSGAYRLRTEELPARAEQLGLRSSAQGDELRSRIGEAAAQLPLELPACFVRAMEPGESPQAPTDDQADHFEALIVRSAGRFWQPAAPPLGMRLNERHPWQLAYRPRSPFVADSADTTPCPDPPPRP